MKITSVNGSPKGRNSNTHKMMKEIIKGVEAQGAEVESIFLSEVKVKHCLGCLACWLDKNKECVIKDDMAMLIDKWTQSDIVICGTPIHSDNVSSILKTFIDRCIPIVSPFMDKDEHGEYKHKENDRHIPKCVIVSNGAYPEQSQFQVISHFFKRLARNSNMEIIAEIYRGQGSWLTLPEFSPNRVYVDAYFELLNRVGEEIVISGTLSDETQSKLAEPLGSFDEYMSNLESYWLKSIK